MIASKMYVNYGTYCRPNHAMKEGPPHCVPSQSFFPIMNVLLSYPLGARVRGCHKHKS
jgi:hypothetical protein